MMEKIIYSKFSNERNRSLAIKTTILEDENGLRTVRKSPAYPEAEAHVLKSLKWEEELNQKYADTKIRLNHGVQDGDSIRYEYLQGKTLETVLDELYLEGKYQQLLEVLRDYITLIRKANGEKRFKVTDEFVNVFGDIYTLKNLVAADVNNIDMVVGNIIIDGDRWDVIDYEWTFDFPIPINFIIFRTIFYYVYATAKREALQKIGFYQIFEISEEEQKLYFQMEEHFQKYIVNQIVPIRDMYRSISKGTVTLDEILAHKQAVEDFTKIQVYFDDGSDFSEANSVWIYEEKKEGSLEKFRISVPENTVGVRIDPAEGSCIVQFVKFVAKADLMYDVEFYSEAREIAHKSKLFDEEDPKLFITNLRPETKEIQLEMVRAELPSDIACEIKLDIEKEYLEWKDKKQYRDTLLERANMVPGLEQQNVLLRNQVVEMQESFCWKITKPIRVISPVLKSMFSRFFYFKRFLKNVKRLITAGPRGMKRLNEQERLARRSFHILNELNLVCDMAEVEAQKKKSFANPRKFSIVAPLYNTPELYLRKMIESVLSQSYENLELCLVDGSDINHHHVRSICKEYRYFDKRIRYKKLKKNMGIADNTNAGLEMVTGDYIVLFDHDDILHPSALYEVMKAIEEQDADFIYTDENTFHDTIDDAFNPHYKPDFSPDTLRSINYICHLTVFDRKLYEKVGGFRREFNGSQDYDMILRLTEQAKKIVHIPKVLYYWRAHPDSVAMDIHAKDYCIVSARKALAEHLERVGLQGEVEDSKIVSTYHIRYKLKETPLISILIPNYEHQEDLERCLTSIYEKTSYDNYEILIIENNSSSEEIRIYYDEIQRRHDNLRVIEWDGNFNFAAINNYGVTFAKGDYILLLNNDIEVISENWLQEMLMFAQRDDVGAVGAKLYYPDDTIQHAGVILGIGGVAGHSHKYFEKDAYGYFARPMIAQNLSAVTAACIMMPKKVFDEIGGFDEDYQIAFNDVDLCMRIRAAGYLIIFTPYAELYHYESKSRGKEDSPEKIERFNGEADRFMARWEKELAAGDPYYNPNLSLVFEDFREKS